VQLSAIRRYVPFGNANRHSRVPLGILGHKMTQGTKCSLCAQAHKLPTLTITAPATAAAMQAPSSHRQRRLLYALWLPFMFGIIVVGGSRKLRRGYWALCGVFLLSFLLQIACGGGNSSNGTGTQGPTNYTVTITGASGAIQHTTQVTVTVQ
jgi:hypothetical protein